MKQKLEMDGKTAIKLYPTAAPEFKEMLEQTFGKEHFTQKITDRVRGYLDVLDMCGVLSSDDDVRIKGFDDAENKMLQAVIQKIRICKVYREGKTFKVGDKRWYCWYNVSSGFSFINSSCDNGGADTASASRLSFDSEEKLMDFVKKFKDIDKAIIDLG